MPNSSNEPQWDNYSSKQSTTWTGSILQFTVNSSSNALKDRGILQVLRVTSVENSDATTP